jgi:hypothetical protein
MAIPAIASQLMGMMAKSGGGGGSGGGGYKPQYDPMGMAGQPMQNLQKPDMGFYGHMTVDKARKGRPVHSIGTHCRKGMK